MGGPEMRHGALRSHDSDSDGQAGAITPRVQVVPARGVALAEKQGKRRSLKLTMLIQAVMRLRDSRISHTIGIKMTIGH